MEDAKNMVTDNMVTITLSEYKALVEKADRINTFERYVNNEEYSISRKMCGAFFNFEVKEK